MNKSKLFISMLFILFSGALLAQESTGGPLTNFPIYQNKLKKSDEGTTHEKKSVSAKFWLMRAELMQDIFSLHRDALRKGTEEFAMMVTYPGHKQKLESTDAEGNKVVEYEYDIISIKVVNGKVDSYTEKVKLHEDPLGQALLALEKAQELDVEGKLTKRIKSNYDKLKENYKNVAIENYLAKAYKTSFKEFAAIDVINSKAIMEGAVDDTLLYYAGMAASEAKMLDESLAYFEKAEAAKYGDADLYYFLKMKYFEKGDTAKGIAALEKGFNRFPDNQTVLVELINYYLTDNKEEAALEYIRIAQQDDPENLSFIFAEATLYDKMGNMEQAVATYEKCIGIDPNYFNAYYNIGVMYYNKAVEDLQAADNISDPKEYGAAKDAAEALLKKSLPYMEKAHELKPEDYGTLESLKTLYYREGNTEKYNEVKEKLEALPEPTEGGL